MNFGYYEHHGIFCGDGKVIHFGRGVFDLENAVVELVDLEIFSDGRLIDVYASKSNFEAEEIVRRAESRLGESGYDLIDNNCEHFVSWCRSGENESGQVNFSESVARQSAAIAAKPLIRKWCMKAAANRIGGMAVGLTRGPVIVASVADTVQAAAEIMSLKRGKTKNETRQIGRHAGLASSALLGWAVGGPVTCAAGMSYWMMGQIVANQTVDTGKIALTSAVQLATAAKTKVATEEM